MNKQEVEYKLRLISYYDAISSSYDNLYGQEQKSKYDLIFKFINAHGVVLDAGCGTGMLIERLGNEEQVNYIVGIDISRKMVRKAKSKISDNSKVDLIVGDCEYLPFRSSVFDNIYVITVIQNLYNRNRAIDSFIETLKSGGRIVLSLLKRDRCIKETLSNLINKQKIIVTKVIVHEKDLIIIGNKLKVKLHGIIFCKAKEGLGV